MLLRAYLVTFLVGTFASIPALPSTYVVHPDGTGDFPTIQAAIDDPGVLDGDIIELTDGTFTGDGNRDIDYLGKAITVRSQSGDPESCVIDCGGTAQDPHRGFHFHSGEGSESVLQGVTITNGHVDESGGGVHCTSSSPTFTNCTFSGNTALGDPQGHNGGGGMSCLEGSFPILTNCSFSANSANDGGGLYCSEGSSPTVTECSFTENSADDGGGICCFQFSHPTVTDCSFSGNSARCGGGLICWEYCSPTVINCSFSGNSASDNSVSEGGGGLRCIAWCSPTVINCSFFGNSANQGGGMFCGVESFPTLSNCTFFGNLANRGGGTYCRYYSSPTLENTIIAFSTEGTAVYCDDTGSNPTLTCCDVYGNAGGDWVGCIAGQAGVNGNISEDPLFCDPENGDFTLHEDSPCAPFSPPNEECDLIGAWPVGCDGPTPTESTTWGRIKAWCKQ